MGKIMVEKQKLEGKRVGSILIIAAVLLMLGAFFWWDVSNPKVQVATKVSEYNNYIGEGAKEPFRNKYGMDESIFPKHITEDMLVKDFKMVYYNPFDAQYVGYLVVSYDKEAYEKELERLKGYSSTEYKGYYSVTGFEGEYELVAMEADSYQGFVYALTNNASEIVYVEMIFANYFMDIDYAEYIDEKYLPDGFDATAGNPYREKMLEPLPSDTNCQRYR